MERYQKPRVRRGYHTHRCKKTDGREAFFCRDDFLRQTVAPLIVHEIRPTTFVDSSCGRGVLGMEVRKQSDGAIDVIQYDIDTSDACDTAEAKECDWFTVADRSPGASLLIGFNPPFGRRGARARQFVDHAAKMRPEHMMWILPHMPVGWLPESYVVHRRIPVPSKGAFEIKSIGVRTWMYWLRFDPARAAADRSAIGVAQTLEPNPPHRKLSPPQLSERWGIGRLISRPERRGNTTSFRAFEIAARDHDDDPSHTILVRRIGPAQAVDVYWCSPEHGWRVAVWSSNHRSGMERAMYVQEIEKQYAHDGIWLGICFEDSKSAEAFWSNSVAWAKRFLESRKDTAWCSLIALHRALHDEFYDQGTNVTTNDS